MAINIISFFILGANVVVGLVLIVVARFKPTWWHWELFLDWGGTAAISVTSVLVDDLVTAVNRYDACVSYLQNTTPNGTAMPAPSRDSCGDRYNNELAYPLAEKETVTTAELLVVIVVVPLAIFFISHMYYRCKGTTQFSCWHDTHNAGLALAQAVATGQLTVEIFKKFAGVQRPDYYALITQDPTRDDANESYPSGHSAAIFATLGVTFLYLVGKSRALAAGPGKSWRLMLCFVVPSLAGYVAVSRVVDYRHSRPDVNAGSAIGAFYAAMYYHIHFHPLWSGSSAHIPRLSERCAAFKKDPLLAKD